MNLMDYAKGNVRTIVPLVVGWLIALALRHGVHLDALQGALTVIVTAVYYAAVRAAERYVSPRFGWLLGLAQQPVYAKVTTRKDAPRLLQEISNLGPRSLTWVSSSPPRLVNADASFRIKFLPPPSGRKHGAIPSPRDDRDYPVRLPRLSSIPSRIDNGAGITWGMLLNDRIGDCYPVAFLHALQVLTGYTPVDADALAVYEQVTGYDPTRTDANGNNPTDRGTAGRPLLAWARSKGLIDNYAAVPANRAAVKAAIAAHKVVLCEWALPVGAEREGARWTMPRANKAAGSWGYHATVEVGYTPRHNDNVTWGEEGSVTPPFEDAYLQAAWVIEVAPSTNVAAIMAKIREA